MGGSFREHGGHPPANEKWKPTGLPGVKDATYSGATL